MLNTSFWKRYFIVYDYLNELIPYQELLESVLTALEIKKNDFILDVGSGTGNLSVLLEKRGANVTGIDSSREGIDVHRKKQPHLNIILSDIQNPLPFVDNSFDKICSNNTIYTIPLEKRAYLFKELHRVLKGGGRIVISNLALGFKPYQIYLSHIQSSMKKKGLWQTMFTLVKLTIPTVKIFYYNYLIDKENKNGLYRFMDKDEQYELLKSSGFVNVSTDFKTYASQAILNVADKK